MRLREHPLFNIWLGMHLRCYRPSVKAYKNYGARGIKVCLEWRMRRPGGKGSRFWNFAEYIECELGDRPPGHQLDRIDNDRGYEPGNVRWSTAAYNNRHRRATLLTMEQVQQIRRLYIAGRTQRSLAAEFGVVRGQIGNIVRGESWI